MLTRLLRIVFAILVGLAGGSLFYYLHLPLPWTLGSLIATAIAVILGREWLMPSSFRDVARPLVGFLAGSAFTPVVAAAIVESWLVILYVASYSVVVTVLGFFFFTKICKYDRLTSFFASTPGGLGELILLGSQLGGNMRVMVLVHTIRIVVVVFAVPLGLQFLTHVDLSRSGAAATSHGVTDATDWLLIGACCAAGYIAGARLKLPGGAIFAPLILSGVLHATGMTQAVPPQWLVACVQIVIGASAGARFAGMRWAEAHQTLLYALIWSVAMLNIAVLMALVGSTFFDRTFPALLLGTAPGGLPEMTIVTYALGIDVAFVITCHVCRVIMVLLVGPQVGTWLSKRPAKDSAT